jgi:hypothetical protein
LFVDSSFQHAAAAMGKEASVVWIGTQPEVFGYDMHQNFKPPVEFPEGTIDSFLHDYNFTGAIHECPYDDVNQMFDVNGIVNSLLQPPRQAAAAEPVAVQSNPEPVKSAAKQEKSAPGVKTGKHKNGKK